MASFNKVILVGNLTRDPEVRRTSKDTAVCEFSVAINESWGKGDDRKESVEFINCRAWEKQAENLGRHKKKGDLLLIEGKLTTDKWKDKDTGGNRTKVVVLARFITYLPRGDGSGAKRDTDRKDPADDALEDTLDFNLPGIDDTPF